MSKGGKLKKLQEEVGDLGKALAKMKAQVEIKTGSIKRGSLSRDNRGSTQRGL
jgi:hypothetical protein